MFDKLKIWRSLTYSTIYPYSTYSTYLETKPQNHMKSLQSQKDWPDAPTYATDWNVMAQEIRKEFNLWIVKKIELPHAVAKHLICLHDG